jgi:penicillin-insensitive murein endopeptidase
MTLRNAVKVAVLALFSLGCLHCSTAQTRSLAEDNPWAQVKTPSPGSKGSIGFYSAGCLDGASALPSDGRGYQVMRLSRNRYYGTVQLLDFIQKFTDETVDQNVGVLLIGDMSQPRGGPMPPPAHASHQIGLDVDIWYWLNPDAQYRPLTRKERETLSAIQVVNPDTKQIIRDAWRPEHIKMLELASEYSGTERIFVNPGIKKELCDTLPASNRAWIHKLRPWYGHEDHFHVRLKCPKDATYCTHQDPVPAGDGCDELPWWFSPEEKEAEKKINAEPYKLPVLPDACKQILTDKF